MSNEYHPKYYSKNLLDGSCDSKSVYGQWFSNKFLDETEIHGDTYKKAINGDRDHAVKIYLDFISQYENSGNVSGCTLDWIYSVIKILVDIDKNQLTGANGQHIDILPNQKAPTVLKVLGLGGKKYDPTKELNSFIELCLKHPEDMLYPIVQKKSSTTNQETEHIIEALKASNLYEQDPHLRNTIDNNRSMTNIISKARTRIRNSQK